MGSGRSGGSFSGKGSRSPAHRGAPDADDGAAGRRAGQENTDHNQQCGSPLPLDRVNRQFTASRPNALWVSDLTYIATWVGFVYVAFVIDVFARRIVGWRVSRTAHAGFVLDALEQALHERRPVRDGGLPDGGSRSFT